MVILHYKDFLAKHSEKWTCICYKLSWGLHATKKQHVLRNTSWKILEVLQDQPRVNALWDVAYGKYRCKYTLFDNGIPTDLTAPTKGIICYDTLEHPTYVVVCVPAVLKGRSLVYTNVHFLKDTITEAFARYKYDIPATLDYGCKIGYLGIINNLRGFTLKTNGKIKEGDIVYNPLLRKLQTPSTDMIGRYIRIREAEVYKDHELTHLIKTLEYITLRKLPCGEKIRTI